MGTAKTFTSAAGAAIALGLILKRRRTCTAFTAERRPRLGSAKFIVQGFGLSTEGFSYYFLHTHTYTHTHTEVT